MRVGSDTIAVDAVVLATGVELPALAAMLGLTVPMQDSPGLLAHTRPHGRLLDRVIVAPGATLKQLPNGEIVTGVDFGGSPSQDTSAAMGQRLLEGAGRFVPRLKEATLDRVTLGWRVLPADGQPIIGRVAVAAERLPGSDAQRHHAVAGGRAAGRDRTARRGAGGSARTVSPDAVRVAIVPPAPAIPWDNPRER